MVLGCLSGAKGALWWVGLVLEPLAWWDVCSLALEAPVVILLALVRVADIGIPASVLCQCSILCGCLGGYGCHCCFGEGLGGVDRLLHLFLHSQP